ncbi:MAG: hypothetical protein NC338_02810 [Firmicutes bacterium]|nr:hypothetical protein [Bacillota bacterium]MCM1400879.1 hypothetical protein [Bacteroides sp.]MCM1476626.1 hypothetical protein [Bacteroides sp.]
MYQIPKTLCIIIAIALATIACAQRTTRKGLRVSPGAVTHISETSHNDTLRDETCRKVRLAGFDKPLRSNHETLFATNNTTRHISAMVIDCEYTDMQDRQLHRRTLTVECDIPPGQTRQLRFKSWDTQQSFHYFRSSKPKKATSTPFRVSCTVTAIITPENEINVH